MHNPGKKKECVKFQRNLSKKKDSLKILKDLPEKKADMLKISKKSPQIKRSR